MSATYRTDWFWIQTVLNEELSKSAEDQVIGSEEDAEETHDEEEEGQEEDDLIPNFEINYENGDDDGLDSEYDSGWSGMKTVDT